jgi:hypothetical protein
MYHGPTPIMGVYLALSARYPPAVLQWMAQVLNECLSLIEPLVRAKLTGEWAARARGGRTHTAVPTQHRACAAGLLTSCLTAAGS